MLHRVKLSNGKILHVEEQDEKLGIATEMPDGKAGWYLCELRDTHVYVCSGVGLNPTQPDSLPSLVKGLTAEPKDTAPPAQPGSVPVAEFFKAVQLVFPAVVRIAHGTPTNTVLITSPDSIQSTLKDHAPVDWGGLDEYPKPTGKWEPAINIAMSWGFKARFRERDYDQWRYKTSSGDDYHLCGRVYDSGKWLSQYGSAYDHCEVWIEDKA